MSLKIYTEQEELNKILVHFMNASIRCEVLAKHSKAHYMAKNMLKRWKSCADSVLREMKQRLPAGRFEEVTNTFLNDEDVIQIEDIVTMLMRLPKGIKNEIESYVESRYSLYVDNSEKRD